jgi:DNA (cytosine-5)-methyltransferase 1
MALTFIDLFAGCGGLSLGLLQNGIQGVCAVEKNASAFATLNKNLVDTERNNYKFDWPDWLPKKEIGIDVFVKKHLAKLISSEIKIDVIAGGPPCQGFSSAGKRDANDPRNFLFEQYIRVVQKTSPKYIILENVSGIAKAFSAKPINNKSHKKESKELVFATLIREKLEDLGYVVVEKLYNAADYGVAQERTRYIMIGCRRDIWSQKQMSKEKFETLALTTRTEHMSRLGLNTHARVTASQALSDLEIGRNGTRASKDTNGFTEIRYKGPRTNYQRLLRLGSENTQIDSIRIPRHKPKTVKQFQKIIDTCEAGRNLSGEARARLGIQKNRTCLLSADKPSKTITTLPDDFVHYLEPRILTVRESARLQSFPDWFEFHGPYTTGGARRKLECPRYTQVGNAVPVLFASYLGLLIKNLDQISITKQSVLANISGATQLIK